MKNVSTLKELYYKIKNNSSLSLSESQELAAKIMDFKDFHHAKKTLEKNLINLDDEPSSIIGLNQKKLEEYLAIFAKHDSFIVPHYQKWSEAAQSPRYKRELFMGEDIASGKLHFVYPSDYPVTLLIGTLKSGKTEALKTMLTMNLIHRPEEKLYICDPSDSEKFNIFLPFCCDNKIFTSNEDISAALSSLYNEFQNRKKILKELSKEYSDLSKKEEKEMPSITLVIEDIHQLNQILKFDFQKNKEGTVANHLWSILTKGADAGISIFLSSLFGGSDYIPIEISKIIKNRMIFKTGSEVESMYWLNSSKAFNIGRIEENPDGGLFSMLGFFYLNNDSKFMKMYYLSDAIILEEFKKHQLIKNQDNKHQIKLPSILSQKIRDNNFDYLTDYEKMIVDIYTRQTKNLFNI